MERHFAGMRYGSLKKEVTAMVNAKLEPIQRRYGELMASRDYLRGVLRDSADRVAPIAEATMRRARKRTGLYGL